MDQDKRGKMTVLLGKDGQPIASDRAKDEANKQLQELESRNKIYRIHPDVAALFQQIITLSMMSAGISSMETINAGKTLCEVMLESSSDDPTGTTMTVNKEWYEEFKANMEGAFAVVEKHLVAQRKVQAERDEREDEEEANPF